jgi:hypothetical protein
VRAGVGGKVVQEVGQEEAGGALQPPLIVVGIRHRDQRQVGQGLAQQHGTSGVNPAAHGGQ